MTELNDCPYYSADSNRTGSSQNGRSAGAAPQSAGRSAEPAGSLAARSSKGGSHKAAIWRSKREPEEASGQVRGGFETAGHAKNREKAKRPACRAKNREPARCNRKPAAEYCKSRHCAGSTSPGQTPGKKVYSKISIFFHQIFAQNKNPPYLCTRNKGKAP